MCCLESVTYSFIWFRSKNISLVLKHNDFFLYYENISKFLLDFSLILCAPLILSRQMFIMVS